MLLNLQNGGYVMDNSVSAIIEADKKARAVSEEAAKKAEATLAAAREKRESLARENAEMLAENSRKKLSELRSASDKEIIAADKKAEEKCRVLDEKLAAGKDAWKKEIISRILSFEN